MPKQPLALHLPQHSLLDILLFLFRYSSTYADLSTRTWDLRTLKNGTDYSLMLQTSLLQFQCTFIHNYNEESNDPRKVVGVQKNMISKTSK